MSLGLVRARTGALVAVASLAVIAAALGAIAPAGCSETAVATFIPGPQGQPTFRILQVGNVQVPSNAGPTFAIPCVAIGTDPDEELPILVAVDQLYLRPPGIVYQPARDDAGNLLLDSSGNVLDAGGTDGPCGAYTQCGHLVLSVREPESCGDGGVEAGTRDGDAGCSSPSQNVYNNSGSSPVIPFLLRKIASREGTFILTLQILNDSNVSISHDGNPVPLEQVITITTSATCPLSDGGMGGGGGASASASSASAGGAGGDSASASSGGAGGAGGVAATTASSSGAGGAGGIGADAGDASVD